jgi:FHA domain
LVARAASEQASLQWQRPDGQVVEIAVWPERVVTIGRESTNTLVIESPFVSKQHAVIAWSGGEFFVTDCQSANGTRLNGAPIEANAENPLQDGDVIQIGDQQIAFIVGGEAEAADPAARAGSAKAAPARRAEGGGGAKGLKLALAAIVTIGVMIGGLAFLLQLMTAAVAPAPTRPAARTAARRAPTTQQATAATLNAPKFDTKRADEAELRAKRAGTNPIEAMYDEAMVWARSGRLLESAQLLTGVMARNPNHEKTKLNLPRVLVQRDQAIQEQRGEAERAEYQLRFSEAARHWEQVLLLTEPSERAHADALRALDAIRQRTAPAQ